MNLSVRPLVFAIALAASPALVKAEIPYGYLGVDLMGTEMTDDGDAFKEGFDDRSGGFRLHGGYRANHWLGVEAGVQTLGRFKTGPSDSDSTQVRYSAASLAGTFYIPLVTRGVEPYFRAGGGIVRIEDMGRSGRFHRGVMDTKPMATAGAGLQFNFGDGAALRLGVDRYVFETRLGSRTDAEGEISRPEQTIDAAYVGLMTTF